ncbi:MAG: S4 domain-containing protein [Dehalococcoidia bacterium]|nr:S4 domain-containing protein [Dehalococcoidia bacterium]
MQRKEVPDEIPEYRVKQGDLLLDVVVSMGAAPSKREARRLFEQRAVTMDGLVLEPTTPARGGTTIQVGKRRWIRLV